MTAIVNSQAEIRAAVGDGSRFGLRVTYIEQEAPLGLAHAVKISEDYMAGEPFVMYLGDNLIKDGVTPFVREFEAEKPRRADPARARAQSAGLRRGRAGRRRAWCELEEKPAEPKQRPGAGRRLPVQSSRVRRGARDPAEPPRRARDHRRDPVADRPAASAVRSHVITGWWKDTGKVEDMLEGNRIDAGRDSSRRSRARVDAATKIEGRVTVGAGTVDRALAAARPLIIGAGARDRGLLRRTVHGDRRLGRGRSTARSSTRSCSSGAASVDVPRRIESSLIGTRRGGVRERRAGRARIG